MPRAVLPAVLVVVLLAACGSPAAPRDDAAVGCPSRTVVGDVPATPTAETTGRLVPEQTPAQALVCRYGPVADGRADLTGEAPLTAGLDRLPADLLLPGQERTATGDCVPGPGPVTPVLLRLTYPDGAVWVAATAEADRCRGATNGRFSSGSDVGDVLVASAATGRWTVPALPDAGQRCVPDRDGRHGEETALLPAGVQALTLCRVAGDGVTRRRATPAQQATVQDVLDEPVAVLSPRSCPGGGDQYELAASYGSGPVVLVRYAPACTPDVDNGTLRADLEPAGRRRLDALLADAFG